MISVDIRSDQKPRYHSIGYWVLTVILPVLALGSLLAVGILPRVVRNEALTRHSERDVQTIVPVRVIHLQPATDTMAIKLPGTRQALQQTYIYSRTTEHVCSWNNDLGAKVGSAQINGGSSGGQPLFRLDWVDSLTLLIVVPPYSGRSIRPGLGVLASLDEQSNHLATSIFICIMSGTLDSTTRPLSDEIKLSNLRGLLYAGMNALAKRLLNHQERFSSLPDNVLYIGSPGSQVAVVDLDNQLNFQSTRIGRDVGVPTDVVTGIRDGDRLVVNPKNDLTEGGQGRVLNVPSGKAIITGKPVKTP